jgi:hypothetical protein
MSPDRRGDLSPLSQAIYDEIYSQPPGASLVTIVSAAMQKMVEMELPQENMVPQVGPYADDEDADTRLAEWSQLVQRQTIRVRLLASSYELENVRNAH